MRGGLSWLLVGLACTSTVNAEPGSSGETSRWRVGPGAGFGFDIAHYPGPGGELFVGIDKALSSRVLFRAEAAGIFWRHPYAPSMPYDSERQLSLDSRASLSQFRLQLRGLGGMAFSDMFAVYAGVVAGHARTFASDTLCGDHESDDFVYGVALQPTLYVGDRGDIEVSLDGDLSISPDVYCTIVTAQGPNFHENVDNLGLWTALRARYRF